MRSNTAVLLVFVCALPQAIQTYNIDVRQPVVRRGFHKHSFFGFSVAQFKTTEESWMIVGAPRDNVTRLSVLGISHPGAIYKCGVSQNNACEVIDVDTDVTAVDGTQRDKLQDQWLGSSVAAAEDGPIVACAHRYKNIEGTGVNLELYSSGRCSFLTRNFSLDYRRSSCQNTSLCQTGTSSRISQSGNVAVLGSLGRNLGMGLVQLLQTNSDYATTMGKLQGDAKLRYNYLGYSTDLAHFGWTENYYVVAGAPRYGNSFGRVVIFQDVPKAQRIKMKGDLHGQQMGAYFGHSVAAVDLNNDGYDDLLVGAPMYSDAGPDQGRVYVYMNTRNSTNIEKEIPLIKTSELTGSISGGRFGHAIAKAGDLNRDSFNDVVISAPYANNGGVVYIFHGSADGIVETPSQIIRATDVNYIGLLGFGVSLSGGMDLDHNSYPDVLVGAYLSDAVILLRSKPIADVKSSLLFSPHSINYPNDTALTVTLCLRYSGKQLPHKLAFNYSLSLDESPIQADHLPRVTFTRTGTALLRGNVTTQRNQTLCSSFNVELHDQIVDRKPITATVTYQLAPQKQPSVFNGNPDITRPLHPVLRSRDGLSNYAKANFLNNCGDDYLCTPDLQISSANVAVPPRDDNRIVLGQAKTINVIVSVRNVKEKAYNPRLIATFPRAVTFTYVDQLLQDSLVSCEEKRDDNTTITCDLGHSLETGRSIKVDLKMNVEALTADIKNFTVHLRTDSTNYENEDTIADNELETDPINTLSQVVFGFLEGQAIPSQIEFNAGSPSVDVSVTPKTKLGVGRKVIHSFTVFNNGPSSVGQSDLVIYWPWKLKKGNDSYLLYITKVQTPRSVVCQTDGLIDPLRLATTNHSDSPSSSVSETSIENTVGRKFQNVKSVLGKSFPAEEVCVGNSDVLCVPICCKTGKIDKDVRLRVRIISRLFERSLVLNDISQLDVTSSATIFPAVQNVETVRGLSNSLNVTTQITQPTSPPANHDVLKLCIVIVVTVLGLVGLVSLLVYCGFFKRQTGQKLMKEKEEQSAKEVPPVENSHTEACSPA